LRTHEIDRTTHSVHRRLLAYLVGWCKLARACESVVMTKTAAAALNPAHHPPQPRSSVCASSSSRPSSASVGASSSPPKAMFSGLARYLKLEKLGEGNYGCVYKARDRQTGQLVALKKIKLDDEDDGVPSTALREVAILQDIVHEHIVRLEQVILEHGQLYLVFEYLDLDLRRYLDNVTARPVDGATAAAASVSSTPKGLPMPLVKSYVYQILLGVEHMHSHRHLHRDLKPQNLLIDRKGRMQIADLGLARAISTPMPPVTHEVATLWYRPPEILLGSKPYHNPVDLWAIGCIMAEMISLVPSFPGDSEIDTLFKIFQCVGTPSEDSWPGVSALQDWHATFPKWSPPSDEKFCEQLHIEVGHGLDADGVDLLRKLLTNCPADRISARQALQHPWFRKASLHCLSRSARAKLDAHAARVAKAATAQAAQRKAEKAARAKKEKQRRTEEGEEESEEDEEEEFEQDEDVEMEGADEDEAADEENQSARTHPRLIPICPSRHARCVDARARSGVMKLTLLAMHGTTSRAHEPKLNDSNISRTLCSKRTMHAAALACPSHVDSHTPN
jgi:serine/threonine protein kinase